MGPIGIIMMPTFDVRKYSELPFASTLNGSCTNVCPVKIDIHEQIYGWREVMEEKGPDSDSQETGNESRGQSSEQIRRYARSRLPPCRQLWMSFLISPSTTG